MQPLANVFSAIAILLVSLMPSPASCGCASNQYWTPDTACHVKGIVAIFKCYDCPDPNAVQYSAADELCVCTPGFYAHNMRFRCENYMGNPDGDPPFHDYIECNSCKSYMRCEGGVRTEPIASAKYWTGYQIAGQLLDDLYVACPACTSGYARLTYEESLKLEIFDVAWMTRHARGRMCKILGQTSAKGSECKCPVNSNFQYSFKVAHAGLNKNVWNYDLQATFVSRQNANDA